MSVALFNAIYSTFSAGSGATNFKTLAGGRLEYGRAPETWTDNYAVMQGTGISPEYCFRNKMDEAYFQINVFSASRASCWALLAAAKSMFDGVSISPTGLYPVLLRKEMEIPPLWDEDSNLWQATIELRCRFQASA